MSKQKLPFSQKWFYRVSLLNETSNLLSKVKKFKKKPTNESDETIVSSFFSKFGFIQCKLVNAYHGDNREELCRITKLVEDVTTMYFEVEGKSDDIIAQIINNAISMMEDEIAKDNQKYVTTHGIICSKCSSPVLAKDKKCLNCQYVLSN